MNKADMKLYVAKHCKQQSTNQKECAAIAVEGQKSRGQMASCMSNEKDQQQLHNSQSKIAESSVKKDGIDLHSSKPARQSHMQGHQSMARGHHRQRKTNLVEQHVVKSSFPGLVESSIEGTKHDVVSDSVESQKVRQSSALRYKDDNKLLTSYEASQGKRGVKLYVAKGSRQQQSQHQQSKQGHVDAFTRWEGLSEVYDQMAGLEPSKRIAEIKRSTPKPARQQSSTDSSPALEGKEAKETQQVFASAQQEQNGGENDGRVSEFEHGNRNPNSVYKPRKVPRPQIKAQQALEDGAVDDQNTSRVVEANGAVIFRDQDGFHQKRGSRPRSHDMVESLILEDTEVGSRPGQFQKQRYQYQPVARSVKAGVEDLTEDYENKLNTRQQDHDWNRCERREGPPKRDRHHGYGYRVADHTG